jgi:hypothetical protein
MNRTQIQVALAFFSSIALTSAPSTSNANGRFPFAQHVIVGPGAASDQIVLRATFGLLWSRDGGRTFDWACEQSLGFEGSWDPPIVFAGGSVVVGLPDGAVSSADGCDFGRLASVPNTPMLDLAASRDGVTVYGVENVPVVENRVFASTDGGRTFSPRGRGPAAVSFDTVELAPSDARRVYVTGLDGASRAPLMFRSVDGAMTLERCTLPAESLVGATGAFVSGVASRDPDTLFVRIDRDGGSHLIRSRDGCRTFSVVLRARGSLRGFALADDGRVWVGGPEDGLQRSNDGGDVWTRMDTPAPTCLRHHGGALYLCVDWVREPYALGRIRDGATLVEPLLRFQDARGAFACGPTSSAQLECAPRWPQQRMLVTTRPIDAGRDASADGGDVIEPLDAAPLAMDASVDSGVAPGGRGVCNCSTVGHAPHAPRRALLLLASVLFGVCAHRRRDVRARRPDASFGVVETGTQNRRVPA